MVMDQLTAYGWTEEFRSNWDDSIAAELQPARVVADFGTSLKVVTLSDGLKILPAELSGKLAHHGGREHVPKVGDWVAARVLSTDHVIVEAVLPRHSEIARKAAGNRTIKQVIAANVDIAFVVIALDNDFSIERLKRFLYQLAQHNITPVIVLNKADKTNDVESYISQLRSLDLPIITTIAKDGVGVTNILARIGVGQTAILLGSSGVGKSTLTNQLLGRTAQTTQEVRQRDDTGKHTTVHRELFVLPNGGLLIDTPGIRELQLWGTEEALDDNFDDIALLIQQCLYGNCTHTSEQGCAVQAALASGQLNRAHYENYIKMKEELVKLKKRNAARSKYNNQRSRRSIKRQDDERLRDF